MRLLICAALFAFSLPAAAADQAIPEDIDTKKVLEEKKGDDAPKEGWTRKLKIGATGAFNHSDKVVGTEDGATVQLGAIVDGSLRFVQGSRNWETTLKINETQTRTPQLETFTKSADELTLKSTYLHKFASMPWLGLYGRARLSTVLFNGFEVRPEATTITRNYVDPARPAVTKTVAAQTKIALTKPLDPTLVREGVGVVGILADTKVTRAEAKLGGAFQHILTRGGFAVADDGGTPEREYKQIEEATQGGAELDLEAKHQISETISAGATAAFFYPFYSSKDLGDASFSDKLNSELGAKVSIKLAAWLSLDYVFSAKRIPLVSEDWQVQHGIMATAGADLL